MDEIIKIGEGILSMTIASVSTDGKTIEQFKLRNLPFYKIQDLYLEEMRFGTRFGRN